MTDLSHLSFAEVAALAPKHDPQSCARPGCRRCQESAEPSPPPIPENPHRVHRHKGSDPTIAGISPQHLAELLGTLTKTVDRHGAEGWQLVDDWLKRRRISGDSNRGGGRADTASTDDTNNRKEDERVGELYNRLALRLPNLATLLVEVDAILRDTVPVAIVNVKPQALAAQVAAEGWCRSCFRDDQHLEPITMRPDGTPFFRDLCKWCGYWQTEHDQLPSVDVLRQRHSGRRVRRSA